MSGGSELAPVEREGSCTARSKRTGRPCGQRAGAGTEHVGVGPCKWHGGATPIRHGRRSRYAATALGELVQKHLADPDPLNVLEELATARALLQAFLQTNKAVFDAAAKDGLCPDHDGAEGPPVNQTFAAAAHLLGDVSKLVARIERVRSNNAISAPELYRVMREMGRVVEAHVKDEALLEKITAGWLSIRIHVGPGAA